MISEFSKGGSPGPGSGEISVTIIESAIDTAGYMVISLSNSARQPFGLDAYKIYCIVSTVVNAGPSYSPDIVIIPVIGSKEASSPCGNPKDVKLS